MSESKQTPEPDAITGVDREAELIHESITGSAQSVGVEPSDLFVAPTMALDAYEPQPDN